MNNLIQSLTGAEPGSVPANTLLMTMASLLLVAIAEFVIAHRNELGWWVFLVGMFVGPLAIALYPGQDNYWLLLGALPQFAVGVVGLWFYGRKPLIGRFTRAVPDTGFYVSAAVGLLVYTGITALLQFGPALTRPQIIFGPGMGTPWLNFALNALVAAGLLGVAFGARWAWLLSALAGAGLTVFTVLTPAMYGSEQPLFGLLLGYVLVFVGAVYGFFAWRRDLVVPEAATAGDAPAGEGTSSPADAASDTATPADTDAPSHQA